jgi:SAM-dependent methyltransferase
MKDALIHTYENSDIYDHQLSSCPLCGSVQLKFFCEIRAYTPLFRIDECSTCGFIFMNPRFKEKIIKNFYGGDYYSGKADYSYHDEREAPESFSQVWDKRIRIIRKYVKEGNFLDVGCSFGGFLNAASKYFVPHGIDISPFAAAHARSKLGDSIHAGSLEDHPFPEGYFSVITMIELLEHLPEPAFALRECHRILRNGGLLVIQTANMDGLQAKILGPRYAYFLPGHLSYFSKKCLIDILKKSGFSTIKVFYPVEFGLLPKLKKSRHAFKSLWEYRKWLRIAAYHIAGKVHFGDFAVTSSMVIYAFK